MPHQEVKEFVAISTAVLMLLLVTCRQTHAQPFSELPPLKVGDLTPYPWSESDEHVRIPKGLLPHLDIKAVDSFVWNGPEPRWKVAEQFSRIYRLTTEQTEALGSLLTKARHRMRLAEGAHLIPVDGPVALGGYRSPDGLKVVEQFSFNRTPYQDDLTEVERDLRKEIVGTLGKERSEHFWRLSSSLTRSFRKFLSNEVPQRPINESHTFRLIEFQSRLSVDLVVAGSGGHRGGPHFEWEDQFAPDSLKPVLKRWRAAIVEYTATNKVPVAANLSPENQAGKTAAANGNAKGADAPSPAKTRDSTNNSSPWDDAAVFVDFPKNLIPLLGVHGLADDDTVSPEAIVVFGLNPGGAKAVVALYTEFQQRFEQLERTHLTRPNGAENHFVLRPFPEAAKTLQNEWMDRLGKVAGAGRAQLLDQSIRTPVNFLFDIRRMPRLKRSAIPHHHIGGWPVWLSRGTKEIQFDVTFQGGPKGNVSINYRVFNNGPDGDLPGNIGGAIPNDWKHLFTPEMFTPDIRRGPKEL